MDSPFGDADESELVGVTMRRLALQTRISDRKAAIFLFALATASAAWGEFLGFLNRDEWRRSVEEGVGTLALFLLVPFWGLLRGGHSKPVALLLIGITLLGVGGYEGWIESGEPQVWLGLILSVPGVYAVLTTNEQRNR